MEKVVIFGTGEIFDKLYQFLNQEMKFQIVSIWDNNKQRWGKNIFIQNKMIKISPPKQNKEKNNIIIMSTLYEEEIKKQLIDILGIEKKYIKPWNYCFNYIKKSIMEKYQKDYDEGIREVLKYLENHEIDIFNYTFINKSEGIKFMIYNDEDCGLLYTYWKGKKIYLKRSINTIKRAERYMALLQAEQKLNSPHCYRQSGFEVTRRDVVVDAGAAEGFYALEAVENAKKIFIVEGDPDWLEALHYTFRPYMDKVIIVPKWLCNQQDNYHITIDEINKVAESKISLIKLDVEGDEINSLLGATYTLKNNKDVRLLVCSYHNSGDENKISEFLLRMGYSVSFSKGYMFYPWGKSVEPELRHGIAIAQKKIRGTILVWGCGKTLEIVMDTINYKNCVVSALIDTVKQGIWRNYEIISPQEIKQEKYDLIVISATQYKSILEACSELRIPQERLYIFWDEEQCNSLFINEDKRRGHLLEKKLEIYERKTLNVPYEYGVEKKPKIRSDTETLYEILSHSKSLCRFGDAEFEMIRGKDRMWYQKTNKKLIIRLREVLQSKNPQILIALADIFGNLDKYTENAANAIRQYITDGTTRNDIMHLLDLETEYFNAFVSRPYLIYRDKVRSKKIFDLMRKIWDKRNVIIVEGKNSYIGVGNDLFENTISIRRIICPPAEAFDKYEEIFETICYYVQSNDLVLISLGQTATVLAYDIAQLGIQAIDIGQIDIEYDWYKKGSTQRDEINGKCIAELSYWHEPRPIQNEKYKRDIIARIL